MLKTYIVKQSQFKIETSCTKIANRQPRVNVVNPLEFKGNYSATSNNIKLVHWPLMGGLLHLVQRGGDWSEPQPAQAPPRCTKCNSPSINGQYQQWYCCIMVRCLAVLIVALKGLTSYTINSIVS